MERKYSYEAGLNVFTSYRVIVPIERLQGLAEMDLHQYHIYSILAYEQFYIRKEKTYCTSQGIHICLFAIINGEEVDFALPVLELNEELKKKYKSIKLELNMPYTSIKIKIEDEDFLLKNPKYQDVIYAQDLMLTFASEIIKKTEFKVLYIGQAYGKDGKRTAFNRLASHSTLQKVLTDCQAKYADKHIYIMLMEFTPQLMSVFDGISEKYTKTEEESDQHMHEVLYNLPKYNQVINITEAALINYFKPEYNVNFVDNFPDDNHKGYKQYFDLDYDSVCIEIDLEFDELNWVQLYSDTNRIDSSWDFIQYQLYNDNNRLSMYDIFTQKNNSF